MRRFGRLEVGELIEVLGAWVKLPEPWGERFRRRLLEPSQTFWLFLSQVLGEDKSCRATVRKWLAQLALRQGKTASPNTAAYCKARARLPQAGLEQSDRATREKIQVAGQPLPLWCEREVKVVDGSSLSMPDTEENQRLYPQPRTQKPGCGFPVMRIVAVFSLATGVVLDLAKSALAVSERTLFRTLWGLLQPGDVLLGDRGFCSYADLYLLFYARGYRTRTLAPGTFSIDAERL